MCLHECLHVYMCVAYVCCMCVAYVCMWCMFCALEYSCVGVLMCPVLAHGHFSANCALHSKTSVQCHLVLWVWPCL